MQIETLQAKKHALTYEFESAKNKLITLEREAKETALLIERLRGAYALLEELEQEFSTAQEVKDDGERST